MFRAFHGVWAYVVVAVNLAVGLWGLGWVRKRMPPPRTFWKAVVAGQAVLAVQVVAGVILLNQLGAEPGFHVFYGFVVLIAAALSWAFRGDSPRRAVTVASIVALFVGAVSVRAMLTAGR
ncbi:MAG TPA: hypothetical protein VNE62_00300 [Actinomycetota bacterium]|nr:hypothetical protein [Actinomycetota bacterium]